MFEQQRISPLGQFAVLLGLMGGFFLIGGLVTVILASALLHVSFLELANNTRLLESNVSVARIMQVVSTFLILAMPAIVFSLIVDKKKAIYELGFSKKASNLQFFLVLLIGVAAFYVSGSLSGINDLIPLPKHLEATFKSWEDTYDQEASSILNMGSVQEYIISVIIIALLPAIFEEMFFRGCMQKVMIEWTKSPFWGILITSIVFSAIHGSYYGFLPRLFLGGMLGYIYYYGRNIWLNILAHFFNNALSVTIMYFLARQGKSVQESMADDKISIVSIIIDGVIGMVALYFLFMYFRKESKRVYATETIDKPADNGINYLS